LQWRRAESLVSGRKLVGQVGTSISRRLQRDARGTTFSLRHASWNGLRRYRATIQTCEYRLCGRTGRRIGRLEKAPADCPDYLASMFAPTAISRRVVGQHNPQIEAEIAAWYSATRLDEDKTIVRRLNKLAIDRVLDAPLGVALVNSARRKAVSGIVEAPLPLFWGVTKTA
jgi:hypothetical protein